MFREMRRTKQLLSPAETVEILQACPYGVLAVHGDQGYPYAVPLSYTYHDGRLFIHFALDGHKRDSIINNEKVSFAVVETAKVVPEAFTTHYRERDRFWPDETAHGGRREDQSARMHPGEIFARLPASRVSSNRKGSGPVLRSRA